ncbi:hypothetical protein Aspvir_009598 [Aspergillus viridinutans]|uniref:Hydrophobin n=1 Tax=Aspergillus viridinutans TaxID=75553 RepID=A0A9P3F8Y1_ASPVI|nr:uncharacterized protein Aspvir_009598 [Aspergillus viridinutans]GIK05486.1 hypothetical protein Aspvir_009598 [Aspergillus viridinutans]
MRSSTIATVLGFTAAGLAAPQRDGLGSGIVSLPFGTESAITLCCSGNFIAAQGLTLTGGVIGGGTIGGGTPTCVAYNSAIQNCATGDVKFTCPVSRGVLAGCSDPSGAVTAPQGLLQEVLNLVPSLLNINL